MKTLLSFLLAALALYSLYLYRTMVAMRGERTALIESLDNTQRRLEDARRQFATAESALREKETALNELQRRGNVIYKLGASVTIHCLAADPNSARERLGSTKLGTVIHLVLADGTTHRLTNRGFTTHVSELENGRFSMTFVYEPEDDRPFFGQQMHLLARVKKLRVNYAPVLAILDLQVPSGGTLPSFDFSVNDVNVVSLSELSLESGDLAAGEAVLDVSETFANVSSRYTEEIQLRIRSGGRGTP